MTIRPIVRALGVYGVAVVAIFSLPGCDQTPPAGPPAAPTLLSLEIPNTAFGANFSGITPAIPASSTGPATYFVLPLLTTAAPIVRVVLTLPTNSVVSVTATDVAPAVTTTLPIVSPPTPNSPGPTTGFVYLHNITSNSSTYYIRYPNSFQSSTSIRTSITASVGGVSSAPLTYVMSVLASTVTVIRVTENNDGRIVSTPPGIDCPGVCTFTFPVTTATDIVLTQGVTSNSTQFMGWAGTCTVAGNGNTCIVPLLAPGPAITPGSPVVTATFRIHVNSAIPPAFSCPPAPMLTGLRWVSQPNCGSPPPLGATLQCDTVGYFCCGPSGGNNSPRCSGGNETAVTCSMDSLGVTRSNLTLRQPGGCYETAP